MQRTQTEIKYTLVSQAFTNISLVLWSLARSSLGVAFNSEMSYIKHVQYTKFYLYQRVHLFLSYTISSLSCCYSILKMFKIFIKIILSDFSVT